MENTTLVVTCPICHAEKEIEVSYDGYIKYYELGYHAQDAFPELSPEIREMLISGVCPTCWHNMFCCGDDDESEDDSVGV